MRIQCDVCESAEAEVMCCADEAALCIDCDKQIHGANKLASKHPRVPLSKSSTDSPRCDICQDKLAYFFCLQDRALLCRACDVCIHSANPLSSSHCRFLVTGAMVRTSTPAEVTNEEVLLPKDSSSPPTSKLPKESALRLPTNLASRVAKDKGFSSSFLPELPTTESAELISTWLMNDGEECSKQFCGDFNLDAIFDEPPLKPQAHEVPRTPSPRSKLAKPKPKRVVLACDEEDDSFLVPDLEVQN